MPADALGTVGVIGEGYGAAVPRLHILHLGGRKFAAEVPANFAARDAAGGPARRADARLTAADAPATVRAAGREHALVAAISEAAAEVEYFLTSATAEPVARVPAVAFRRATVEPAFRPAEQEAGLMHYEGRDHTGPARHPIPARAVLGFVAAHTERPRGGKPRSSRPSRCAGR